MVPGPANPASPADIVRNLAAEQGFALVGISRAAPSEHADFVRQWIADGKHGEMHYLAENLDVRLDPQRLLEGAKSIICVADFYASQPTTEHTPASTDEVPPGRVARYAWGDDYHKVIKKRLFALADGLREQHPGHEFRAVVDTAPALEREHATRAGLGWVGKHTLMIHPRHGSWMLIGLLLSTLELESSDEQGWPGAAVAPTDHCGTCTQCIEACPTDCIEDPAQTGRRSIDGSKCISYLTLEHRSLIPEQMHEAMGDWLAGCDICQEVCPFNRKPLPLPIHPRYAPRQISEGLSLMEVLGWTVEQRQDVFRGSALKRVKLDMLKRNALIAAGNAMLKRGNAELLARVRAIASDENEPGLVRETACQVLGRINKTAR